jgi:hypothetical protein
VKNKASKKRMPQENAFSTQGGGRPEIGASPLRDVRLCSKDDIEK